MSGARGQRGSGKVNPILWTQTEAHLARAISILLLLPSLVVAPLAVSGQKGFDDAHVHLNDPATWVRLMDEGAVARSVVFRGRDVDHEDLVAASDQWPGRLLPFVSISPEHREYRGYWERDDPAVVGIVDSLLSTGRFVGIGEISVSHFPAVGFPEADFDPNGSIMSALLSVAERYHVPVSIHCEVTRLREFERLLEAFPRVRVIWAHGGYTPLFLAQRLLTRHDNLVYELSARTWQRHPRSPDYTILSNGSDVWRGWLELVESMPDRFLVGTDASLRSAVSDGQKIEGVQRFLDQLSPETRGMVAAENLRRILGG